MSKIKAGVIRGQIPHIEEHRQQKKAIYRRYREGLKDLPVSMNPIPPESEPNYWLSSLLIDEGAMAPHARGERDGSWKSMSGKSSPSEILEALAAFNAEGRPIWKPMHLQPVYRTNPFVTVEGEAHDVGDGVNVGADVFARGCCLPSDNKMTAGEQGRIIEVIGRCFE